MKFTVKKLPENEIKTEQPMSIDLTDQACAGCSTKTAVETKENLSITSSSDDDDTEQAISLNMNKKSHSIALKGKVSSKMN